MSGIKLSICIPTYNREAYLRNALTYCRNDYRFDFPFEIVICDNASTDGTRQVVEEFISHGLPIRYYKREVNAGASANVTSALRLGRGEYLIYLADDDILIAEAVAATVKYLDENREVTCVHAPWFMYDEVAKHDITKFYNVEEDRKFAHGSFTEVFQYICERNIFPEIAVYRASALRSAWIPRDICFYPFPFLAHFLDQGAVTFLQRPFYRSIANSAIVRDRPQEGANDVMTSWDRYRGGLEYFLYTGVRRGAVNLTPETRLKYEEMCRIFTLNRMAVAFRFWAASKNFIKAYELYTRLMWGGMLDHPEIRPFREGLPLLVAIQTLVSEVNSAIGIKTLLLAGFTEIPPLENLLRELGLSEKVRVTKELSDSPLESTAVFVSADRGREYFVALGYLPNLVFHEHDLARHIIM
ncbi:glycosyltransferase family 2 protein [Rhizobium bangladeshense]|uniref:Glycosyltransferase family 2 protein n=1 Tax=Rhizobium bangladeshense TaxID=1138189 RepID=A0ABS7LGD5_9HYPH|nr:glycosyltransferase family 2 protein [Rhizobium bangladeshense]MBX4871992.1 glycosyltransferase family 2 protein [Rhizobium bangladeshense]MBX4882700.1 glycosyltransferase family 2 protein [Rhizobium bangladeshense]MBX4896236.1 glycosyltransferase family 2 protein [Rhizobium bangladeshense]MBX4903228.1 glycosyltransferase family 2 protein [Rhizobium bangladeshense]MBX4914312.1 glycosyltransferase family 2 protein [Rhizobium bangladeshense]